MSGAHRLVGVTAGMTRWSGDDIATLRRLAGEGLSGGQIASRVSVMFRRAISRCAVIGACQRHGIALGGAVRGANTARPARKRGQDGRMEEGVVKSGRSVWTPERMAQYRAMVDQGVSLADIAATFGVSEGAAVRAASAYGLSLAGLRAGAAVRAVSEARAAADAARALAEAFDAAAGRVPLIDLGHDQCRFYIGEPGMEGSGFCGGPVGAFGTWCDHHRARVFAPPSVSQMVRLRRRGRA